MSADSYHFSRSATADFARSLGEWTKYPSKRTPARPIEFWAWAFVAVCNLAVVGLTAWQLWG